MRQAHVVGFTFRRGLLARSGANRAANGWRVVCEGLCDKADCARDESARAVTASRPPCGKIGA